MELRELLRRWQAGESIRAIARSTGLARNTVNKYLAAAEALGLTPSGIPATDDQLAKLVSLGYTGSPHHSIGPSEALLTPYRDQIEQWLKADRLKLTRVQELLGAKGCHVPYSSLHRFVLNERLSGVPNTTVRMDQGNPGQYAEMDFGRLGYHVDPTTGHKQLVYVLIVVLSYSRHMFIWPTIRQTLAEVIDGLESAWRFFGGVPHHLILDNFPAAVSRPDSLHPRLTKGFLDYAQFRGFLPDPARVRHPKDKPHVERMVPYVRERFFKGGSFLDLADMRIQASIWSKDVAGCRIHGTTHQKPLLLFLEGEQSSLLPLEPVTYQIPTYATLKVHLDHHLEFSSALYSVPFDRCPVGSKVEVVADRNLVRIYYRGNLVKTHIRQPRGGRSTDPADYPPEKVAYASNSPELLCRQAADLGPNIGEFARRLLSGDLPWTKMRQAQKLLRLADRYTQIRLEAACSRALLFDLVDVYRLERILIGALDQESQLDDANRLEGHSLSARFARPGSAFARSSTVLPDSTIPTTQIAGGS
ncbi:MAG: IS21 family transposase [Chloroflexota bacterium]